MPAPPPPERQPAQSRQGASSNHCAISDVSVLNMCNVLHSAFAQLLVCVVGDTHTLRVTASSSISRTSSSFWLRPISQLLGKSPSALCAHDRRSACEKTVPFDDIPHQLTCSGDEGGGGGPQIAHSARAAASNQRRARRGAALASGVRIIHQGCEHDRSAQVGRGSPKQSPAAVWFT